MTTSNLGNCPNCGKLYIRIRDLCDVCYREEEETFLKAARYIRDYPRCSIQEVSDATGVSISQIYEFIRSGRIIAKGYSNWEYPCEICGEIIHSGRVCGKCLNTANELKNHIEKEAENQEKYSLRKKNGYIKYL